MEKLIYDLIIIGAGPAGLSASLYASRYEIRHIVFGSWPGGLINEAHQIDNYLGIENVSGIEFGQKIMKHAKKYSPEIKREKVEKIYEQNNLFKLQTEKREVFEAKTILLATGTRRKKLGVKGEEEFLGKGISYCATCDGFFYKNKKVIVVGGNDSAVGAAIYLSNICREIILIYRKEKLRAEPFWLKILRGKKNIQILYNTEISQIAGSQKFEKILIDGKKLKEIHADGIFIEIGSGPDPELIEPLGLKTIKNGYIKVKSDQKTSLKGVWAAGDITDGSDGFRQVITAAAEGAIAARSIYQCLQENEIPKKSYPAKK